MAQDPNIDQNNAQQSFKVNVPKSASKYTSNQHMINSAKCQLYQWIEVRGMPSPQYHKMYVETIQKQYPAINFNDEQYNEWMEEIGATYLKKIKLSEPHDDDDKTNDIDTTTIDPEWLSLQDGTINSLLLEKYNITKLSLTDRCLGCVLGVFVVDALGAPVEGWPYESIMEKHNAKGIINMTPGTHMGARNKGPRCGYYTDDTMTTMALALSIVQNQKLLAQHAAENYYKFWKTNPIYRGLPDSAQKVLTDVFDGMSITKTGRQSFADGSFANGGAMRISSVGLTYRNATRKVLKDAVIDAIMSSHCHPQSIDGALCIALMIQYALKCGDNGKDGHKFNHVELGKLILDNMETEEMKNQISIVLEGYNECMTEYDKLDENERESMDGILESDIEFLKKTKLLTFQIKAIEAVPFVLYALLRWYQNPEQCAINVVTLGGDCDTTGSMVGGILGCLYGTSWLPNRWYDNLENTWNQEVNDGDDDGDKVRICTNAYGLDLALYLGVELAKLNFVEHDKFEETKKEKDNGIMSKIKSLFPSKDT